jgi:hypothetical protein
MSNEINVHYFAERKVNPDSPKLREDGDVWEFFCVIFNVENATKEIKLAEEVYKPKIPISANDEFRIIKLSKETIRKVSF